MAPSTLAQGGPRYTTLAYVLAPVFQRLLYECHELVGYCAIDYAVIVA